MKTTISFVTAMLIAASSLSSATMKAIVAHDYGGPEVLKLEDVPVPTPKDDEILVKVFAAGVNSFDGVLRSGKYAKPNGTQLPWHPGYDIAGVVDQLLKNANKQAEGATEGTSIKDVAPAK